MDDTEALFDSETELFREDAGKHDPYADMTVS